MNFRSVRELGRGLCSLVVQDAPIGDRAAAQAGWASDAPGRYCRRCGASVGPGAATAAGCAHCRSVKLVWDGCYRLGAYKPPLAGWIVQMKFARLWSWCCWFGEKLVTVCDGAKDDSRQTLVTPIPLHWRRRFGRGYDQAVLIAEALADVSGWTYAPLLHRTRSTKSQSLIHNQADRLTNVRGAFGMDAVDLSDCRVLLVDDVKTSGSTAAQCARLLRRNGAARIDLAVIAVADPKHADFQRV